MSEQSTTIYTDMDNLQSALTPHRNIDGKTTYCNISATFLLRLYKIQAIPVGNALSFLVKSSSPNHFPHFLSDLFHMVLLQVSLLLLAIVVLVGYACWLFDEALISLGERFVERLLKTISSIPQRIRIGRHQHSRVDIHTDSALELTNAAYTRQGQHH